MADKSLRVKLFILSLLEHNSNQPISHFCSFNSRLHAKFAVTKILIHLRLTLTQPYQTSSSWTFLSLQFRWKFICLHVFR